MKNLPMIFLLSLAFTCLAESEVVDGVTWHFKPCEGGVAVIRDPKHNFSLYNNKDMLNWEYERSDLKIPSVLGGRPVVRIENSAFADGLMSITSIDIPSTVKEIGNQAFIQGYGLTSVTIPHGVRKIGHEAFRNCYQVRKLELPSTVTEIGAGAFAGMVKLRTVVAPASVQERFPNIFPHSPDVKWRRSRTPWVVGCIVLVVLLIFRKPLFRLFKGKEPRK